MGLSKKISMEQIRKLLKERAAGVPLQELEEKYGVTDATMYKYAREFGGGGKAKRGRPFGSVNKVYTEIAVEQPQATGGPDALILLQTIKTLTAMLEEKLNANR